MEIDPRVTRHYDVIDEGDRLAKPGLGDLVRLRTWDVFARFLPGGGSLLDVGGATGVHAEHLAEAGYDVVLVEPVLRHVEAARARSAGRFRVEQGVARELPAADGSVDGVLLMGPLYHLIDPADRLAAIREALRVLRPGGVLLAEVIARHAWILDATKQRLLGDPEVWAEFDRTVATGLTQDPVAPREGGFFAYFHRMDELRAELTEAGGRDVELVAVEGFGWLLDDLAERMRSPEELIRAIRLTESEPSMLGVSAHVIGVARAQ
jgi:SAM-dependent methyltransferase